MTLKPQAIFFDFDGVILESADVKTDAFVELFSDYPDHIEAIRSYHLSHMGVSRFKKFEWIHQQILHRKLEDGELEQLGKRFSSIVFDKVVSSPFVPGAKELLDWTVENAMGFVASGTPEDELKEIVAKRGLHNYFREVCGSPRSKTQIVQDLVVKYNLLPSNCLFIGDANTDHIAALETGVPFAARSTPVMMPYWDSFPNLWLVNSLREISDRFSTC